jgi:hypothetical protein
MQQRMDPRLANELQVLRCPRCGAEASADAGHCSCCGSSLGLGGRTASGERVALRMAPGLGQAIGAPPERALSPLQAAQRASPTGQGFAAVRSHMEYARWMADEPTGAFFMLGYALQIAFGLFLAGLVIAGKVHARNGTSNDLMQAVVLVLGFGCSAFAGWQIACYLQAPLLRRVARVADTRSRTYHTKSGWRTRNYATFDFEDGSQHEFQLSSAQAENTARGDCGVLISRYTALLAFHRVGLG